MEDATSGLGFWHESNVRAWGLFIQTQYITCVPGGALGRTELGSGTLSQEHQVISAVLVRREMVPEHFIQTQWQSTGLWVFSLLSSGSSPKPWLPKNTKFPEFKPAPELNQTNHLIPQETWESGVRCRPALLGTGGAENISQSMVHIHCWMKCRWISKALPIRVQRKGWARDECETGRTSIDGRHQCIELKEQHCSCWVLLLKAHSSVCEATGSWWWTEWLIRGMWKSDDEESPDFEDVCI